MVGAESVGVQKASSGSLASRGGGQRVSVNHPPPSFLLTDDMNLSASPSFSCWPGVFLNYGEAAPHLGGGGSVYVVAGPGGPGGGGDP